MSILFFLFATLASKQVQVLTDSNFDAVQTGKWLVVFSAEWCPYCTKFKDTVQQLPLKLKGYQVGTVDIDTESALNSRFLIQKLPSVYIIEEGIAKEILPNFNVDELVDTIKTSDKRSPMFIQPFGVIGYLLFYLGFCGKYLMTIVKYLQVYLPTWIIIGLGALLFTITFFSLVLVTRPTAKTIDDKKKKQ